MLALIPFMSLHEALGDGSRFDPGQFTRLSLGGQPIGWIGRFLSAALRRWPDVFAFVPGEIALLPSTPQARSDALGAVARALEGEGLVRGWRNERYTIFSPLTGVPMFALERAAVRAFGLTARSAHLNGYVRGARGLNIWVARRSESKPIDPGMLDNLVGGGIAEGMDAQRTLEKESAEEAGIPPTLVALARRAGSVRVTKTVPEGVQDEILHTYDLELAPDFRPANHDGEVAEFRLAAREEMIARLAAREFTVDAGIVAIDFLLRHGCIPADIGLERQLAALRAAVG